jgi:hypothetical protein
MTGSGDSPKPKRRNSNAGHKTGRKLVKRFVKHVDFATYEAIDPNYSRPPTSGAIARALEELLWNFRQTELDYLDARLEADLEQLTAALHGIAG